MKRIVMCQSWKTDRYFNLQQHWVEMRMQDHFNFFISTQVSIRMKTITYYAKLFADLVAALIYQRVTNIIWVVLCSFLLQIKIEGTDKMVLNKKYAR